MAGELMRITNGCNPAGDRRRLDSARCLKGDECGNCLGGCWKFGNFSFVAPGPEYLEICAVGAASSFGFLGAREGDGGGDLRSGRDGCRRGADLRGKAGPVGWRPVAAIVFGNRHYRKLILEYTSHVRAALSVAPENKATSAVRVGIGWVPPQKFTESELVGIERVEIDGTQVWSSGTVSDELAKFDEARRPFLVALEINRRMRGESDAK